MYGPLATCIQTQIHVPRHRHRHTYWCTKTYITALALVYLPALSLLASCQLMHTERGTLFIINAQLNILQFIMLLMYVFYHEQPSGIELYTTSITFCIQMTSFKCSYTVLTFCQKTLLTISLQLAAFDALFAIFHANNPAEELHQSSYNIHIASYVSYLSVHLKLLPQVLVLTGMYDNIKRFGNHAQKACSSSLQIYQDNSNVKKNDFYIVIACDDLNLFTTQ